VSERLDRGNLLNNTKTIFFTLRLAGLDVVSKIWCGDRQGGEEDWRACELKRVCAKKALTRDDEKNANTSSTGSIGVVPMCVCSGG